MSDSSELTYAEKLQAMIAAGKTDVIANEDHSNNADITLMMLSQGGHLRMYCGKMSIFRKEFYGHIAEKEGEDVAADYKNKMVESLKNFFEDEANRLEIILAAQCKLSDLDDFICKNLFDRQMNAGRLSIKVVDSTRIMTDMMPHFMLSPTHNMVRIERNPAKHSAHFWVYLADDTFKEMKEGYEFINQNSKAIAV